METSLDHGKLVVSGSGVAADFDVSSEQNCGFLKFLVRDSQIGQLQQRFGEVRIRLEGSLNEPFGGCLISLPLFDVSQVEQARSVAGIEPEALLEISSGLVEAPQVPVRESQRCIGGGRGVEA